MGILTPSRAHCTPPGHLFSPPKMMKRVMAFAALLAALAAAAAPMVAAKDYDYCKKDCPHCCKTKCKGDYHYNTCYDKCYYNCKKYSCQKEHEKCSDKYPCCKGLKCKYGKCVKPCIKQQDFCDPKHDKCCPGFECVKKGDDCGGKDDLPCCNKFGLKCEDYKCIKPKTCAKKGQSCSDLPCCNGWGLVCDKGNICTKPAKCAKL